MAFLLCRVWYRWLEGVWARYKATDYKRYISVIGEESLTPQWFYYGQAISVIT